MELNQIHRYNSTHLLMFNFLQRNHKYILDKKKASSTNGACQTGCLCSKEFKVTHSIPLVKTQVQLGLNPQHETKYTELDRGEKSLDCSGIAEVFLNQISIALEL